MQSQQAKEKGKRKVPPSGTKANFSYTDLENGIHNDNGSDLSSHRSSEFNIERQREVEGNNQIYELKV